MYYPLLSAEELQRIGELSPLYLSVVSSLVLGSLCVREAHYFFPKAMGKSSGRGIFVFTLGSTLYFAEMYWVMWMWGIPVELGW